MVACCLSSEAVLLPLIATAGPSCFPRAAYSYFLLVALYFHFLKQSVLSEEHSHFQPEEVKFERSDWLSRSVRRSPKSHYPEDLLS